MGRVNKVWLFSYQGYWLWWFLSAIQRLLWSKLFWTHVSCLPPSLFKSNNYSDPLFSFQSGGVARLLKYLWGAHCILSWGGFLQKSAIYALCHLLVRFRIDNTRVLPRAHTKILFEEVLVGRFRLKRKLFNRYRVNGYWVAVRLDPPNAIS